MRNASTRVRLSLPPSHFTVLTCLYTGIAKNPDFYYGAFGGILVSQAAFTFIYRFMSNKSAEYPEGAPNPGFNDC